MTPEQYTGLVTNHWKFRLFMITRLPMAWLAGLRVKRFDTEVSEVQIRYKYLTKNPFRSIYFAAMAMAAELSTGIFAFRYAQLQKPMVSMLVTGMEASYHKKAVGRIRFVCEDGGKVRDVIEETRKTGEGVTLKMKSCGYNSSNELVAEFWFTWSFKVKSKKA